MEPRLLSNYLSRSRQERRLSQQALAELAGCTRQYIAQLEGGLRSKPSYRIALGLANALGLRGTNRREFLELAGDYSEKEESATDREELRQAALSAIYSISYPAYIHDNLWRLHGWNQAAEQLFGVSPNQIVLYSTSLMEFVFDPDYRSHIVPWAPWAETALRQFRHDCKAVWQLPSSREVMTRLRRLPDFRRMWEACDPVSDAAPLLPLTFRDETGAIKLTIVRMQFPGPPDLWVNVFVPLNQELAAKNPSLAGHPGAQADTLKLTVNHAALKGGA